MIVITPSRALARIPLLMRVGLLAAGALLGTYGAARAAEPPPLKIPLEPMGYQTLQTNFLMAGSTMMTVHFVDPQHLLVTFALRKLMHRDERTGAPEDPEDIDRTIGARLVELPSRKVVASTEWRVHDHGQYLWSMGRGRFLLRIKDRLSLIAPLEHADDAFHETGVLNAELHILAVIVSPEGDLLTVESAERAPPPGVASGVHFSGDAPPQPGVQLNFYRIDPAAAPGGLLLRYAGVLRSRNALSLPVTTAGFLDVIDGTNNRWLFDFDSHAGKKSELAEFQSSCFPRTTFVSHTQFVAFGCRGVMESQTIGGFNLRGEEMWQQNFSDIHMFPTFSFAPEADRFALGRMLVSSKGDPTAPEFNVETTSEEVRVYQMHTGKLLLRLECSPTQRAGQNFALSPDGMKVAVVRETGGRRTHPVADVDPIARTAAIEVYTLPGLTKQDETAIQAELASAPPGTNLPIQMATTPAQIVAGGAPAKAVDSVPAGEVRASTPMPVDAAPVVPAATVMLGDVPNDGPQDGPRKAPTLYAPDEKPK